MGREMNSRKRQSGDQVIVVRRDAASLACVAGFVGDFPEREVGEGVPVSSKVALDRDLSLESRGVYVLLASYAGNEAGVTLRDLARSGSIAAVKRAMDGLIRAGYLRQIAPGEYLLCDA